MRSGHGTDPDAADTDMDGVEDGMEIEDGTDPLLDDTDGDGLLDGEEKDAGTRLLLEQILTDEERHLEDLSLLVDQSERFGMQCFMMCVCGSGVPAPGIPR